MHKTLIVLIVLVAVFCFNTAYSEPSNLEIKIQKDSSNPDQHIKSFYPPILPITHDDTISWVNEDSVAHSITSGVPAHPDYSGKFFSTGIIKPGSSGKVKITDTSSFAYYYFCEIHPWLTGKIVISTAPESQPETSNPIVTNAASYHAGQTIFISGQVHRDFAKTPYQILLYDNEKLVETIDGTFDENASYKQQIKTSGLSESEYTLKVVYGLPTQVGITSFSIDANPTIPSWIKNGAKWWADDKISDSDFINGIEYLSKENIITIQKTGTIEHISSIPTWIKTNASWWADDLISDDDFVSGLQYMVNAGIIQL